MASVLDSGHWAEHPRFKHWPGHCVVFFSFHSASLHPGVKKLSIKSNYDRVLGKPDKLSGGSSNTLRCFILQKPR